jgi:hypothetical protein
MKGAFKQHFGVLPVAPDIFRALGYSNDVFGLTIGACTTYNGCDNGKVKQPVIHWLLVLLCKDKDFFDIMPVFSNFFVIFAPKQT